MFLKDGFSLRTVITADTLSNLLRFKVRRFPRHRYDSRLSGHFNFVKDYFYLSSFVTAEFLRSFLALYVLITTYSLANFSVLKYGFYVSVVITAVSLGHF